MNPAQFMTEPMVLEGLRTMRFFVWGFIVIWFFGSVFRNMFLKRTPRSYRDSTWALFWFIALYVFGYNIRWMSGLSSDVNSGADIQSRIALNVLILITGVAVLVHRYQREGTKW